MRQDGHRFPRRVGLLAVAGLAMLGITVTGGMAVAASMTGEGRGSGSASVAKASLVTLTATPVTGVYPGGPASTVTVTVQNAARRPLVISGLAPDPDALPPECGGQYWLVDAPTELPIVPARGSVDVQVSVGLALDAPDTCQGVDAAIPFTLTGRLG
jgi:hypothetical protein